MANKIAVTTTVRVFTIMLAASAWVIAPIITVCCPLMLSPSGELWRPQKMADGERRQFAVAPAAQMLRDVTPLP